jgi:hypothetical protein
MKEGRQDMIISGRPFFCLYCDLLQGDRIEIADMARFLAGVGGELHIYQ